jgi:hypothetical protein
MLSIGKFFERIQSARTKELYIRSVIQGAIKKNTAADIPLDAISFRSSTANLKNINQSLRSIIFIKKGQILRDINSEQNIRRVEDIR